VFGSREGRGAGQPLKQLRLHDLPVVVLGQVSDELIEPGSLESGDVPQAVPVEVGGADFGVGGADDERDQDLPPFGVRCAQDSHLVDVGVCDEHVLDLFGVDVAAARDDDFLRPSDQREPAGGVEVAEVASA
jgi:hypothetical protein